MIDIVVMGRRTRRTRAGAVSFGLATVAFALFILTMMVGSFYVPAWDVITSAIHLRDDPSVDFIVRDLRLPTAAAALAVGFALGVSGLLFQKLLGNPLASPDFVGISSGASMATILWVVVATRKCARRSQRARTYRAQAKQKSPNAARPTATNVSR